MIISVINYLYDLLLPTFFPPPQKKVGYLLLLNTVYCLIAFNDFKTISF